jgi:diacylglycerol kinase (ATP)
MKNSRFLRRMQFAQAGLKSAFGSEKSFRTQLFAAVCVLLMLLILRPSALWCAILIAVCALVLVTELLNTAIEHLADHLHPERHPQIKIVKDCAAGAVLLASASAAIVGAAFVYDYFLAG